MSHTIGLDIGGTKILAVLTDHTGKLIAEHQEPTDTTGPQPLVEQIAQLVTHLARDTPLAGIGIGLPASVDPKTNSLSLIPNIAGMEGTGFYQLLTQRFALPIALENDVNAAALAEAYPQSPAQTDGDLADPMAFIAIGTGIGMGIVNAGQLLRGAKGAAGEIAYLPLGGQAKAPSAPLEDRLGGEGWRAAYRSQGGQGGQEPIDLKSLFETPDEIFKKVIDQQADLLAQALLAISAVLAPEVFVFGGSIGSQPRLISALTAHLDSYFIEKPLVRPSIHGPRAGALGAARAVRAKIRAAKG